MRYLHPSRAVDSRAAFAAALITGLAALVGCAGQAGEGELMRTRYRFIAEDPQGPPPRDELFDVDVSFEWRLDGTGECLAIWPAEGAPRSAVLGERTVALEYQNERVRLTLDFPGEADGSSELAGTDRLDVELRSHHPTSTRTGDVAVYWAGRGEKLSDQRKVLEGHGTLGPDGRRLYRMALGAHGGWTGKPRRMRWVFVPPVTGEHVSLCGVTGIDETLPPKRLSPWLLSGWKGTLGGQIRNALPAVSGVPIARTLEVPADAELRLLYGAPGGVRGDLDFEVWVRPAGGQRERVAGWRLGSREALDVWHEAVVDLASYTGGEVTVSLVLVSGNDLDPAKGLPLWGNPEVVAP